jgi:hypothetical protein
MSCGGANRRNIMYIIRYKARGEHGGSFESAPLDEDGKNRMLKSLRADPNVIKESIDVEEVYHVLRSLD